MLKINECHQCRMYKCVRTKALNNCNGGCTTFIALNSRAHTIKTRTNGVDAYKHTHTHTKCQPAITKCNSPRNVNIYLDNTLDDIFVAGGWRIKCELPHKIVEFINTQYYFICG